MFSRYTAVAGAVLAAALACSAIAEAAPVTGAAAVPVGTAPIDQVAGGCGIGGRRGPYGACRRNVYAPVPRARAFYGRPVGYGVRCAVRPTPYGPRRVCW